jgi:hypothetical protein
VLISLLFRTGSGRGTSCQVRVNLVARARRRMGAEGKDAVWICATVCARSVFAAGDRIAESCQDPIAKRVRCHRISPADQPNSGWKSLSERELAESADAPGCGSGWEGLFAGYAPQLLPDPVSRHRVAPRTANLTHPVPARSCTSAGGVT